MRREPLMLLCVLAVAIAAASCEKLPAPTLQRGPLQVEAAQYAYAIPLDYGTLVSVTPTADSPYIAGLWFEKPDKTVVYVRVNVSLGKIYKDVLVLPRR